MKNLHNMADSRFYQFKGLVDNGVTPDLAARLIYGNNNNDYGNNTNGMSIAELGTIITTIVNDSPLSTPIGTLIWRILPSFTPLSFRELLSCFRSSTGGGTLANTPSTEPPLKKSHDSTNCQSTRHLSSRRQSTRHLSTRCLSTSKTSSKSPRRSSGSKSRTTHVCSPTSFTICSEPLPSSSVESLSSQFVEMLEICTTSCDRYWHPEGTRRRVVR